MGAVGLDELVHPIGIEVTHLRDQPRAADRRADELLVGLTAENGQRRVLHRGDDDRARVDQRAVEIEEDRVEAHGRRKIGARGALDNPPPGADHDPVRILVLALVLTVALAAPAAAQQDTTAADTTAADTTAADTTAADTTAADTTAPAAAVPHVVPSLEGYVKVAILYRDMLPGAPGDETSVEVYRSAERAQVLRFVTGGQPWALVVRPAGAEDSYTLRDHDCSGDFTEELEAGTPLAVPDCAGPATPAAPPPANDDD